MELIVPAKYYTFSDFTDPSGRESGGDSGKMLIARRKPGVDESCPKKLLIKHRYSNDPCNEFMYSRIAESLGVPATKVYLISCPAWRKSGFNSRYICGIEYIDGLRNLTQDEFSSEEAVEFTASAYCLSALLFQGDQVSLGATSGGFYSYDFAETFMLGSGYMDALLGNSIVYRRGVWLGMQQTFKSADHMILNELSRKWADLMSVTGEIDEDKKWLAFMKPVRNFPETITDERIEVLTETIRRYYGGGDGEVAFYKVKAADVLAWYYKEYLLNCRQACEELLCNQILIGKIRDRNFS